MNTSEDYWTTDAMILRGGSFVRTLGNLARRADEINLRKIKDTWPEYWQQYEQMGDRMRDEQELTA